MIKSQFTDPRINNHGFVKHIHHRVVDCGVVPGTTTPLIEAYQIEMIENLKATSGTGGKPRNLALFRKVLNVADPRAGAWDLIAMWEELKDYEESSAAGSVDVLPDGTVHVSLAFGKKNAAGAVQYQPWEASVARSAFAPPIERLPVGGEPGPPGPPGSGGLVLFDAPRTSPAWNGRVLNGGEWVDIPAVFDGTSWAAIAPPPLADVAALYDFVEVLP